MASENKSYIEAMRLLRRSSAASKHRDQHAERKKGFGKGGRKAWKRDSDL